jgi:CBS domain-containing protein
MSSAETTPAGAEIPLGPKGAVERSSADQIMNPRPRTCSKFSTVMEAVLIFKEEDCGLVPVVDEGKPIGVITDRDVALALARYTDLAVRPVSEVMNPDLATVTPETSIHDVVQTFISKDVRRLLVVDAKGLLAGVITWADIVPWLSYQQTGLMVAETVGKA